MSVFGEFQEDVYKRLAPAHPAQKFRIPQAEPKDFFRLLGQAAPAGMFGAISGQLQDSQQPQPEELPVTEEPQQAQEDYEPFPITPPNTRELPRGVSLIRDELIGQYPEGSEIDQIIKKGYSAALDQTGNILGFVTPSQHLVSPEEALNGELPETLLQNSGYLATPENIDKFIRQNDDLTIEPKDMVYTGLKSTEDKVLLKSKPEIVMDTVLETPIMQVLTGLQSPLEIIAQGLQRYEAVKTSIILNMPLNPIKAAIESGKSIAGTAETEFPDAALRNTLKPELGDIFRKMGMIEPAAAGAGLVLDILTDGVILGMAGKGSKAFLMSKKIGDKTAYDYVVERWMKFRGQKHVDMTVDALKGKGVFDIDNAAELKTQLRKMRGTRNVNLEESMRSIGEMRNWVLGGAKEGKDFLAVFKKALAGDTAAMKEVPHSVWTLNRAIKSMIGRNASERIAKPYMEIFNGLRPDQQSAILKQAQTKFGRRFNSAKEFAETVLSTGEDYTKRSYGIFSEEVVVRSKEEILEKAKLLSKDYNISLDEAITKLKNLNRKKEFVLPAKGGEPSVTISSKSFIKRQDIPKYMREYMREIDDPFYNYYNTIKTQEDIAGQLQFTKAVVDAGLSSPVRTEKYSVQVTGDLLSKGYLYEQWVTDDVAKMLTSIQASTEKSDRVFTKIMQFLKFIKTAANPKTHGHNIGGNMTDFAGMAGITPFDPSNWRYYKDVGKALAKARAVHLGLEKPDKKYYPIFKRLLKENVVMAEFGDAEFTQIADSILKNPLGEHTKRTVGNLLKDYMDNSLWLYNAEDQIFKGAAYLKYVSKKGAVIPNKVLAGKEAVEEVYKWFPNYIEASRLANEARNNPWALFFLSPFLSFRSEAHRIMLNGLKGNTNQLLWLLAGRMGKGMWNIAALSAMGLGMSDIREYFMSRPEAVSETVLNPLDPSGNTDLNVKYVDPLNTEGLFAPLMVYARATGVAPHDYLLDFTNYSPEFGYSNLLTSTWEGVLTGRGRYGQDLSLTDRLKSLVQGVTPTTFGSDIPKILSPESEPEERLRHVFKTIGIDLEERAPSYAKSKVRDRLVSKLRSGEDITALLNAIEAMGFNAEAMRKAATKKVQAELKKGKIKKGVPKSDIERGLAQFGL